MTGRVPPIYLDYHATTPVDPRVAAVMMQHLSGTFGNAHSRDHILGDDAERVVEAARNEVALLVGTVSRDVIFTSGATEAINLALVGLAFEYRATGRQLRIGASAAEHLAVLDTARWLAANGLATLALLPVDQHARVELSALETASATGLDLICVMAANNEVGTISDFAGVGEIARRCGAMWMCDATQAVGRIPIAFGSAGPDLIALSAHKFYGPKGIGALVTRAGIRLSPQLHGGGHERGMRSGTLNVPSIAAFGEAARLRRLEMTVDESRISKRRDALEACLARSEFPLVINGDRANRLAGNLHVSFTDIPNQAIIARVRDRLAISTGAACSSGIEAPSHVLRSMGVSQGVADGALRFGIGKFVTDDEIAEAAELVSDAAKAVTQLL